jgi:fructosamine-3-kinase
MQLLNSISILLSQHFNVDIEIFSHQNIGGGSINTALKIETNVGDYFVKANSVSLYPDMFEKEASGLQMLKETQKVSVPDVVTFGNIEEHTILVLELMESGNEKANFWDLFANNLASLHKTTNTKFGLDHDNYIGSLSQMNAWRDTWSDFFRDNRLDVQLKLARDSAKVEIGLVKSFERFYKSMDDIFPKEPASLIHGDLWGGNFMIGKQGTPYLIDPAIYFGNREMDLGMTKLFGGFSSEFYLSYQKYFPMEKGWEQRLEYCNLYPLLVHVNLFGNSYLSSVKSIISKF